VGLVKLMYVKIRFGVLVTSQDVTVSVLLYKFHVLERKENNVFLLN
jgi:hypothetical protein